MSFIMDCLSALYENPPREALKSTKACWDSRHASVCAWSKGSTAFFWTERNQTLSNPSSSSAYFPILAHYKHFTPCDIHHMPVRLMFDSLIIQRFSLLALFWTLTVFISVDSELATNTNTSASRQNLSIQLSSCVVTSVPGLKEKLNIQTLLFILRYNGTY